MLVDSAEEEWRWDEGFRVLRWGLSTDVVILGAEVSILLGGGMFEALSWLRSLICL